MKIGFTGTRKGMNSKQKAALAYHLGGKYNPNGNVHFHGGCIGADKQFHDFSKQLINTRVEVLPGHFQNNPDNTQFKANCEDADFIHESQSHFKRNRQIVDTCDLLIAAPLTNIETTGGTWYTINYAKKQNKELIILER